MLSNGQRQAQAVKRIVKRHIHGAHVTNINHNLHRLDVAYDGIIELYEMQELLAAFKCSEAEIQSKQEEYGDDYLELTLHNVTWPWEV